jgi:hypothetical protein
MLGERFAESVPNRWDGFDTIERMLDAEPSADEDTLRPRLSLPLPAWADADASAKPHTATPAMIPDVSRFITFILS